MPPLPRSSCQTQHPMVPEERRDQHVKQLVDHSELRGVSLPTTGMMDMCSALGMASPPSAPSLPSGDLEIYGLGEVIVSIPRPNHPPYTE